MRTPALRSGGTAAAAALLLCLLAPAPAFAAAGSLSGRLETSAGGPATGVSVYASGDPDRYPDHVSRTTTDADGRYRFDGIAADGYDVGIPADHVRVPRLVGSARVAVVRGALVSAVDGSSIAGLRVSTAVRGGDSPSTGAGVDTTAADGSFPLYASPADLRLDSAPDGWFDVRRALGLHEGEQVELGAVRADPSGDVAVDLQGRSGRSVLDSRVRVVVDGCRRPAGHEACPGRAARTQGRTSAAVTLRRR